jgi:ProP effector
MKPNPAYDTIGALAAFFPAAFSIYQFKRRPLKIGIYADIMISLGGAITRQELNLALAVYTGNYGYLRACRAGAPRIGLNGGVVGHVTEDEAANARERFDKQRQKVSAAKKAAAPPKARRLSLSDLKAAAQAGRMAGAA